MKKESAGSPCRTTTVPAATLRSSSCSITWRSKAAGTADIAVNWRRKSRVSEILQEALEREAHMRMPIEVIEEIAPVQPQQHQILGRAHGCGPWHIRIAARCRRSARRV